MCKTQTSKALVQLLKELQPVAYRGMHVEKSREEKQGKLPSNFNYGEWAQCTPNNENGAVDSKPQHNDDQNRTNNSPSHQNNSSANYHNNVQYGSNQRKPFNNFINQNGGQRQFNTGEDSFSRCDVCEGRAPNSFRVMSGEGMVMQRCLYERRCDCERLTVGEWILSTSRLIR